MRYLLTIIFITLRTAVFGQQFAVCALPDTIEAHGEDLCLLRLTHYNIYGDTVTGKMIVNRRIAKDVCDVFRELYEMRYPIERMEPAQRYGSDEMSMRANNTSGYLYRKISGTGRLSKHARGMAVDVNPLYNPCFRLVEGKVKGLEPATAMEYTDRKRVWPCTVTRRVVRVFKKHGFRWGGDWKSKKDYQHFEK